MNVNITVNGKLLNMEVAPDKRLIDILREDLGLTGTKEGCGEGECGACTVLLDNKAVHSCLTLAAELDGSEIITIEGLEENGYLSKIQQIFVEETAIQCGFCTPGMIMSAKALLMRNPNPSEEDIHRAIAGNICRCSTYSQVTKAVKRAAAEGVG